MAAFPSSPGFQSIKAIRRTSTKLAMSPYNFTQQVYSYGGKLKVVEFTLPPMTQSQATTVCGFLDDLNGYEGTFEVNLSGVYPDESGLTAVEMRLVNPDFEYSVSTAMHFGLTFTAMEAL